MIQLFFKSFAISLVALLISFLGLGGMESYGIISMFIVAFFVHRNLLDFFLENKTNIIDKKVDSKRENIHTYAEIVVLFFGIALGYGLYMELFSSRYLLEVFRELLIKTSYLTGVNITYASFLSVLATNIAALVIAWVFTVIFDEYAVALLVSLGAVILGISSGYLFSLDDLSLVDKVVSFFLIVLPNSLLAFSLIVLSVGIYYVVKGYRKYATGKAQENPKIMQSIWKTFSVILTASLIINLLSTAWESLLLPVIR